MRGVQNEYSYTQQPALHLCLRNKQAASTVAEKCSDEVWAVSEILLTYLLTPWCRVFLEKLTDLQLVKKFPAFHGTRRFITALTSVRHLSLSWASPIQSIYPHSNSWRSILISPTHLCLVLPCGLLVMQFPPFPRYLVPPRSKYSPQHHILEHPQLPFLPQCQRPSFTSIQNNRQNYISVYLNL